MNQRDNPLFRHLAVAVVVKLALLLVLWWVFVRDIGVDSNLAARHIVNSADNIGVSK